MGYAFYFDTSCSIAALDIIEFLTIWGNTLQFSTITSYFLPSLLLSKLQSSFGRCWSVLICIIIKFNRVLHVITRVFSVSSCSTRVLFVFPRVILELTRVHLCSTYVFIRVLSPVLLY